MNRQGFIGGSDAVKIMQGDWYDLWCIKTGRNLPEDLSRNLAVQMGTYTENFNLAWFEQEHDCILHHQQQELERTTDVGVPIKGTLDAMWHDAVVEAKHTNAFNDMESVIEWYMPQIQLYMWLAGAAQGAYLSVFFGNNKWESAHVAYDGDYTINMLAVIADFWRHVEEDREPLGIEIPKLDIISIPIDQMVVRDASQDNMFVDAAVTYVNGYEQNRIFENAKKDLKNMVGSDEREVFCDQVTVKRDKRGALRITKRNK